MFRIEYEYPTAYNYKKRAVVFAETKAEADELCRKIDDFWYKLLDVTNVPDDYVEEE